MCWLHLKLNSVHVQYETCVTYSQHVRTPCPHPLPPPPQPSPLLLCFRCRLRSGLRLPLRVPYYPRRHTLLSRCRFRRLCRTLFFSALRSYCCSSFACAPATICPRLWSPKPPPYSFSSFFLALHWPSLVSPNRYSVFLNTRLNCFKPGNPPQARLLAAYIQILLATLTLRIPPYITSRYGHNSHSQPHADATVSPITPSSPSASRRGEVFVMAEVFCTLIHVRKGNVAKTVRGSAGSPSDSTPSHCLQSKQSIKLQYKQPKKPSVGAAF